MFLLQLKYELLRTLRSSAIWLIILFIVSTVSFGLYNGQKNTLARRASVQQMLDAQRTEWNLRKEALDSIESGMKMPIDWRQSPSNPIASAVWMVGLDIPSEAMIAIGMSDLHSDLWRLNLEGKESRGDTDLENPINLLYGAFDLAFVLAYLLPLLVIAGAFNLISEEREQGTLAIQRSQPVGFVRLYVNKMLARFGLLSVLILLVVLTALGVAGIAPGSSIAWKIVGISILYALFWFLICLGINLYGGTSDQNALRTIGIWLFFSLVSPALVNLIVGKVYPVPSRASHQTALRNIENQLENQRDSIILEFYASNPSIQRLPDDEKKRKDWYREEFAVMTYGKSLKDSIEQQFIKHTNKQGALADALMLFSPILCVNRYLSDLARTSSQAMLQTQVAVDGFQTQRAAVLMSKFEMDEPLVLADYSDAALFREVIPPVYVPYPAQGLFLLIFHCLLVGLWVWRVSLNIVNQ
jgi:ABC-2 type transport system permease protein